MRHAHQNCPGLPSGEKTPTKGRMVSVVLWRFVRLLFPRRHNWEVIELVSRAGSLIYTVRDCKVCGRREIKHAMRPQWTTFTSTQFSHLPCFEDWHREQYLNAVPHKPNVSGQPRPLGAVGCDALLGCPDVKATEKEK